MANEARYPIRIDSNAAQVGAEGAASLDQLRQKIDGSTSAIRAYNDTLRKLTGTSDEVKAAKKELTDKINAEKTALTQNTLAVNKAGTSYDQLAKAHKKANEEMKKGQEEAKKKSDELGKSIEAVGGPVGDVQGKISALTDVLAGAGGSGGMGLLAVGAAAAVAGVVAVSAAVIGLTATLAEFILTSGNQLRTQQLTREAFYGNAEDAKHLGNQIDELGKKIPTSRAELNEMGNKLALAGIKGQTLVDTLNAVGQTSAAVGGSAGAQISNLVERSRLTGRFALGYLDTQGTGIKFQDVAKSLAKDTHTSVQEASTALIQGQVSMGQGAQALRETVEARFGKTNLAKSLDLDVLKTKLSDIGTALTSGVNIQPVFDDLKMLEDMLDTSNESGADLKALINEFGGGAVSSFHDAALAAKDFSEKAIGIALDIGIAWLDLKIAVGDTFGYDTLNKIDMTKAALAPLQGTMAILTNQIGVLKLTFGFIGDVVNDLKKLEPMADGVYQKWSHIPWKDLGSDIAGGIIGGFKAVVVGAEEMADDTVKAIKTRLGIASPSKVMRDQVGRNMGEGVAVGLEDSKARVNAAISNVSTGGSSSSASAPAAGGSAAMPPIHVEVNYHGGAPGKGISDDFETKVKNAIVEAFRLSQARRAIAA